LIAKGSELFLPNLSDNCFNRGCLERRVPESRQHRNAAVDNRSLAIVPIRRAPDRRKVFEILIV
jgi:hypothetical protein